MLIALLCLLCALFGGVVGFVLARRPRRVVVQDRFAGLRAYQDMKNGR